MPSIAVTLNPGDEATAYNFSEAGLQPTGLSKRMLLLSTLRSVTPEEAAIDAAFASLTMQGLGDIDGDSDIDTDDRDLLAIRLGDVF